MKMNPYTLHKNLLVVLFSVWLLMTAVSASALQAGGVPFQTGDVLAGVGNGQIKHFNSDGVLVATLDTGAGNTDDAGMAFDAAGNLYATAFEVNTVYKFDNRGNLVGAFASGFDRGPESIVFDKDGNAYVGQADGTREVRKFSPDGVLLDSYSPQLERRGTDWIELAPDQCTLRYTSEGRSIKQFNVCTKTQLPDFATGLSGPCFAHEVRPNFEELVTCAGQVYRLNSSGAIIQTYTLPGTDVLFGLSLDPDNKTFWTDDALKGTIFRVDIATGNIVKQFSAGVVNSLAGLAVVGKVTAATGTPPFTTSWYVLTTTDSTLKAMGEQLAKRQLAANVSQDSVAALLFRAPTHNQATGEFGTSLMGGSTPISTIEHLAEDFASGYYNATGTNNTIHVRIVIATSNGTTQCGGNAVTFEHGEAWAQMVNRVASWVVDHGYAGQVDIAGGSDMELDSTKWPVKGNCGGQREWADRYSTRAWVDGYSSVMPRRFLYNVGSANGCLKSGTTAVAANCNAGYTQDDVWYISWGAPPSEPLPEIYTSSNAKQWTNLSLYGFEHTGASVIMSGALTEFQACVQNAQKNKADNTCTRTDLFTQAQIAACADNLPTCDKATAIANGWQQFFDSLNAPASPHTAQTLPWSTDIKRSSH